MIIVFNMTVRIPSFLDDHKDPPHMLIKKSMMMKRKSSLSSTFFS